VAFVTYRVHMSRLVDVFITAGGVRIQYQASEPAAHHLLNRYVLLLTYLNLVDDSHCLSSVT